MSGKTGETGGFLENARTWVQGDFKIREKEASPEVVVNDIFMSTLNASLPRVEGGSAFKGLIISFTLDGRCAFENGGHTHEMAPNTTNVMYTHEARGCTRFRTHSFRCICIRIRDEMLDRSLLDRLSLDSGPVHVLRNGPTDPVTRLCLAELLAGQYDGALNNIFVQGKALEILASEFSRILPRKAPGPGPGLLPLTRQDLYAIQKAKDILVQSIADPPSIPALSRMVGLNQFKLKKGFRQVFNTTPYAIVRNHRMKVARQLLQSSDFNASEISRMVGIKNPCHFTRAFARCYGMLPRDVMKTRVYVDLKEK